MNDHPGIYCPTCNQMTILLKPSLFRRVDSPQSGSTRRFRRILQESFQCSMGMNLYTIWPCLCPVHASTASAGPYAPCSVYIFTTLDRKVYPSGIRLTRGSFRLALAADNAFTPRAGGSKNSTFASGFASWKHATCMAFLASPYFLTYHLDYRRGWPVPNRPTVRPKEEDRWLSALLQICN